MLSLFFLWKEEEMIGDKRVLAIIPARGGSKRLPKKNIRLFDELPLILHSVNAAKGCNYIDELIVSTDCDEIAKVATNADCKVDIRSSKLSSDDATTIDVLKDLLSRFDNFDIVVTLQPTSPLRTAKDIENCLNLFAQKNADAIASVCMTAHPPQWINCLGSNGEMDDFVDEAAKNKRSQDLGEYFLLNGAVYCNCVKTLMMSDAIILDQNIYGYVMPRNRSVDIDTLEDFELAEFYLKRAK